MCNGFYDNNDVLGKLTPIKIYCDIYSNMPLQIVDDSRGIVRKAGDSGGGLFVLGQCREIFFLW